MWSAIFGLIASMPKLLGLLEQLISWISDQVNQAKIRQGDADAKAAAEKAKETHDTTDLDNLFDPRKNP